MLFWCGICDDASDVEDDSDGFGITKDSANTRFLRGELHLEIVEAKDLPNVDTMWGLNRTGNDKTDAYVTVDICVAGKNTCRIAKTRVIDDNLDPKWNESFKLELCHDVENFSFDVKDKDLVTVEKVCAMKICVQDVVNSAEQPYGGWFPLMGSSGSQRGSINISMRYVPSSSLQYTPEVPDVPFPMRQGCVVKLYQDAHTPAVPPVTDVITPDGRNYDPPQLWVDISDAIEKAQKFIYVVGWSVKANMTIIRDGQHEMLGDTLKRRASEGVRVLVMVWNEALSSNFYPPGMMGTHDEETRMFFQGSDVECLLTPRRKASAKIGDKLFVTTTYTHHQKCVIVDAAIEEDPSKRRIVAFAGGVDLTDGRFDTPEHNLYKTLTQEHKDDFYNGITVSKVDVGPREPWHDIHMYVEGRAARDLLANFVERWRRQGRTREDRLLPITEDEFDLFWEAPTATGASWNVQLFRSINADSAQFDYNVLGRLLTKKGRYYDNSIQRAYIHHIRRAKKFIYMENQYFLGSSSSWSKTETKCPHLVPIELTARILQAIDRREDFRVYVLIPIHPEGDPTSAAVQEILHWQHLTMEMMYRRIAHAIHEKGLNTHPTDYLAFFCLGKRENPADLPPTLKDPPANSVAARSRSSLRFMIYVHSKMAIFDDEYIIVGSANINERSMSGNRDSELALGSYQPALRSNGNVKTFRLALWAEHTGAHSEVHLKPSDLSCMKHMKEVGDRNLKKYLSDVVERNDSHLMTYPVKVTEKGAVKHRDDCKEFPDTKGTVLGRDSAYLPNALTT